MLKKLTQKRNKKGFTLVELIVVIAILGILAAIAVPRLSGFTEKAAISADKATAASIGKAAELYAASNPNIEIATINIDKLVSENLISENPKAQFKKNSITSFVLTPVNGIFVVKYNATPPAGLNIQLYPAPTE